MKKLALLGAMFALPLAANAHNYNYLDISYANGEAEDGGDEADFDALSIHAKRALGDILFVDAGASSTKLDELGGIAIDLFTVGLGAQTHVTEAISAYGVVSYDRIAVGVTEGGYGLAAGLRGDVSDTIEINASYKHTDFDEVEIGMFRLGGVFDLSERCAVTLGYQTGDFELGSDEADLDSFDIGIRMYY